MHHILATLKPEVNVKMRQNTHILIRFVICGVSNPPFSSLLPVSLLLAALSDTLAFASAWFPSVPSRSSRSHVCNLSFHSPRCLFECRWRSEGWRHPQAFPSIYPSQETPPPKVKLFHFLPSPAASWETALTSVSTQTNTQKTLKGCVHKANVVVWFTCSAVTVPSLRAGLPHQTLPLTGRRTLVSFTPETGTRRHGEHAVPVNVWPFSSYFCIPSDVDLDAVVSSTERLSHPTASRPRVTDRRPRSQIITPVSSSLSAINYSNRLLKGLGSDLSTCSVSLAVFSV